MNHLLFYNEKENPLAQNQTKCSMLYLNSIIEYGTTILLIDTFQLTYSNTNIATKLRRRI